MYIDREITKIIEHIKMKIVTIMEVEGINFLPLNESLDPIYVINKVNPIDSIEIESISIRKSKNIIITLCENEFYSKNMNSLDSDFNSNTIDFWLSIYYQMENFIDGCYKNEINLKKFSK